MSLQQIKTRVRQRPLISLAIALALVALPVVSVLAATTVIDLTALDAQVLHNGALFRQGPLPTSAGTGVLDPFLRVSTNDPVSQGYNTDWRPLQFNEDGAWTESLLLSTVTDVEYDGVLYREFYLDINQVNSDPLLTLDQLKLYTSASKVLHDFSLTTHTFGADAPANLVWDLGDARVLMNYSLEPGSGVSDVSFLVPESVFAGAGPECGYGQSGCQYYVYLYSRFGDTEGNNDGFEEWSTLVKPAVQVSKTANGTYSEETTWEITKSVTPATWDLFTGESGTSGYTVAVKKTVAPKDDYQVTGTITIVNPAKLPDGDKNSPDAVIQSVEDVLGATSAIVSCGVDFPHTLKGGQTLNCTYTATLTEKYPGNNIATVTVLDANKTFKGEAPITWAVTPVGPQSINVTDTNGQAWTASDSASWTYTRKFVCDADAGKKDNTATITETKQSASASVQVNCYTPAVTKDAKTYLTRTWNWKITKSVTPAQWDLFTGESGTSKYTVAVDKVDFTPSGWAVDGTITISNPAPMAAEFTKVTDELAGPVAAAVTCPGTAPYTVPANGTLVCTYKTDLPTGDNRLNTATATQQLYDYSSLKVGTKDGTKDYSGTATADFSKATVKDVNAEINVTDTYGGALGTASDDKTFPAYYRTFVCDENKGKWDNTATIVETKQDASASVQVNCWAPTVTKDAKTSLTRTWEWKITKSVTPAAWDLFTGESGTSKYTVAVDKVGSTDTGWGVNGTITINNPTPIPLVINDVKDVVSTALDAVVTCPGTKPWTIAAGEKLVCTYVKTGLPDAAKRLNTATATQQLYNYDWEKKATADGTKDYSGTADVIFDATTTVTEVYPEISVTDTYGGALGKASDDKSWEYSRKFVCDADAGKKDNTATITETKQDASASVQVNCWALAVTKDANTSWNRYWSWTIEKKGDQTYLKLMPDETFLVNYVVTVDATYVDKDFMVKGAITVNNPAPIPAVINGVKDILTPGDIAATVDCKVTFPYTLPAGQKLVCSYEKALLTADPLLNTATATQQLFNYDWQKVATADGTKDYSGTADVIFSKTPTDQIDECADFTDSQAGPLGTVCADKDTLPFEFKYSILVGPWTLDQCGGQYEFENCASGVTNDTQAKIGPSCWKVVVEIPCPGCTYTQGYWKTHSSYGPAPYDMEGWGKLGDFDIDLTPEEADELLFSGGTWHDVFKTAPKGGNAWYILAHQFMAAYLNVANGAGAPPMVGAALGEAYMLLKNNDPATFSSWKGTAVAQRMIELAGYLDQFNNGYLGIPHCEDEVLP